MPGGKHSESYVATTSFASDDDEKRCKINLSELNGVVAWNNGIDLEKQHTSDLRIDLYVDTKKLLAMFKLHGFILLKDGNTKKKLYLLVHPETIQSIEFARSHRPPAMQGPDGDNFISLEFTMTQPPSLVAPTANKGSYEPRPRYQALFDSMKSLATLCQFTVYLNRLNLTPEYREQLALLPSVFSSSRPFGLMRTDEILASFDVLFHGGPGQVIDLGKTAPPSGTNHNQTLEEIAKETAAKPTDVIPPPYTNDSSSRNAPGYLAPIDRKRRISESLSPVTTDEQVQPPSTSGSLLQSPNQFSTPTDRKRRRTSELLSHSPTDKHILLAIRRVLGRTASLDVRVKQVEKLITECLNAESTCRYDTEEVEQIFGHINTKVDERIDDHLYDVRRELEGALLSQTEEWVAETVELAQEELRKEIEDEWVEDIREDITVKMEKMVKREVLKDMAQAVKVMRSAQAHKDDAKPTTRRRMSTSTASTQSTVTSTKPIPSATLNQSLPGAADLQTAIRDIQRRYSPKISAEEMMRVLDFLGENLIEAVKYNGCGTELKWLYVQRWAAKQ
ncbi:hypothetical protein NEUTE1DRAFT_79532 [Neurospora tetrasperma FGSC 2508]|uniref:Uncharacterized protein n=1 Tax=Neurospora tetrasperma (strain FGSC 2508 / ATCC MYA-4615 / P0657) TaxID=510951 RepID=F8MGF9_NEUT8|nr:uncharacterized protein NEUTE1DRAFT_79532 [Neurospora tetrasperma FGSC 2508]EGO59431.1 hypothetical protein NEUTE1DRAFT_79532 [Neurospora tetrasperma FGSC 2508]EGZ73558.1 hypothetical protein NEUTE2DRAFT_108262 [Neurospora tetrasperma FGSC 2509]